MVIHISGSRYKDQDAVTIESDRLAVQFLPGIGAKMSSLVYKPLSLELLVQRPGPTYRIAPYEGDFTADGECSGLDDMFPTIDRCFYTGFPWHGTPIPDHGEVWTLPWDHQAEAEGLHFTVTGVRFPYRLEKWISFVNDHTLRSRYRVTNLSRFDFDFLWAAHPMFVLEDGAELRLPAGVERISLIVSLSGALGRYGDELDWPVATSRNGHTLDLRRIRPKTAGDAEKYYISGKMPEGWCELTYPQSRLTLRLDFPVAQVPYLAILPNAGGFGDLYNIFLEPCTATFDRPDLARLRGECATVKGQSAYEWHYDISLCGENA